MTFQPIDSKVDVASLEREIQKLWRETHTFERKRSLNEGKPKWSFIDGPITANNPMGVHHAWGRTYKDLWQRYWSMRGRDVRYQNGFDCQGLWVEVEVEKELGFETKRDIEAYGIAEFVKKCIQRVLNYSAIQTEQSIRLGYWCDWNDPEELRKLAKAMENPMQQTTYIGSHGPVIGTAEYIVGQLGMPQVGGSYYTLSDENNYMIWTALKSCHERGWIYKGQDSMPWCPRCSTGISQHEIVTEGYKEITHTTVYVRFPLKEREGSLLIWTTTPWTLTSNVAVAAHPELTYVKVKHGDEILYLSKGTLTSVFTQKGSYKVLEELKGKAMDGWRYSAPYDDMEIPKKLFVPEAHRVIMWDAVGETEGTGLVHIAPGAGKEDFELGKLNKLPVPAPLDEFGVIIQGFGWLTGTHVYNSAEPIFDDLKSRGFLLRTQKITHRYPTCWRCGSELVFRLVNEWFINMGEKFEKPYEEVTNSEKDHNLRYQIMDSASDVHWIPDFGLKRELDWLQNMDDWMISKKRYWGLALPIWQCSCGWFTVIGDKEELKSKSTSGWDKFEGHSPHRPYIDSVKIRCERCGNEASRIPEVGNPWLDAGIVGYSTLRYRSDHTYWEKWFPADFITESFPGQFRNWFYAMLAESTILERRTPYKVCLGHGNVLAEDGQEMHKSWGNAIWFDEAAETMGADVMRWIYCAAKPENDVLFGYTKANEVKRMYFMTLLNVYNFFTIYANLDKWTPDQQPRNLQQLDRWVLSRLNTLIRNITTYLENYDALTPTQELEHFVDALSKWYVRRSRRRFWKTEADDEKKGAYATLYKCLKTVTLLMAPFTPHVSEAIYQRLVRPVETGGLESVHLNDWPSVDESMIDEGLMTEMDLAMSASSLGRAARAKSQIKLRQPLSEAIVVVSKEQLQIVKKVSSLIREELNVKEVKVTSERDILQSYVAKPVPRLLGRKHGRNFTVVAEAIKTMTPEQTEALAANKSVLVNVNGNLTEVLPEEVELESKPVEGYSIMEEAGLLIGINTAIDQSLSSEGLARDIVRRIQSLRKEANYDINDHIETYYRGDPEIIDVFQEEAEYIKTETLSDTFQEGIPPKNAKSGSYEINGLQLLLGLCKK
ncbi:MAG: class I tRNA ligase family protein [Candidatus Bathyarchaeia archaeon]|jgi:isoleucyl-tRNA synthetase